MLIEVIEPSIMLLETVDESPEAVRPLKEPSTILPLTLLFEITDDSLVISLFMTLFEITDWLPSIALVTMLFEIIDEVTEISPLMILLSIFNGLLLEIEVWSIIAFSIRQPELVCSLQPLLEVVKVICPPLKVILSVGLPLALRVPFTHM